MITARNVRGGRFTTLMLGGLNYQIEKNLFPTMPRPNLAGAQNIIRAFCAEHDLVYHQDSLVGSYRRALRHLRSGEPERTHTSASESRLALSSRCTGPLLNLAS